MVSDKSIADAIQKRLQNKPTRQKMTVRLSAQEEAIIREAQAACGAKYFAVFLRQAALVGATAIIKDTQRRKGAGFE